MMDNRTLHWTGPAEWSSWFKSWLAPGRPVNVSPVSEMAASPHEFEFSYEGMPVGYFEEDGYPTGPGRYRYMPYRSPGHYEMQTARRAGARPRCNFSANGRAVSFAVVDCPEYGVLEAAEFDAGNVG